MQKKILIIGANGMLGSAVLRVMAENTSYKVFGSIRSTSTKQHLPDQKSIQILSGIDAEQHDSLVNLLDYVRPDVVVNCIGIIKQKEMVSDPLVALPINSIFPHRLARLCKMVEARLIHISTDCVFSGLRGNYIESDPVDARDLYGISKAIGEVTYPYTITLRTSIIGHELYSSNSLLEWFLLQENKCKGYRKAIFSGLPTVILAAIIRDYVIPNQDLTGLYHVASEPVNKYELLKMVAKVYKKSIEIIPDDQIVIDRSLNASRFQNVTGFLAPSWPKMIELMYAKR